MMDSKAPMPWIGLYAAVASLIWTLSLVIDAVISVRHRKLWFPCRYSSLNAASLTVLAVAVKLSMDLTTPMKGNTDQRIKSISTAFLCVSTTHFMPSLGSMSDRDILVNLTALGILIVTLTVNVIIQVLTGVIEDGFQVVIVFMNVYAFIILSSSALTVFTSKRYLDHKYNELQTRILAEELQGDQIMDFDKLKFRVKKYWVMAETGNPQFVMARSEASILLFMICLISFGYSMSAGNDYIEIASDYKWSVHLVGWTQYLGMVLCVVMSFGRLLATVILAVWNSRKCTISSISLEIKNYRINRLVEWKKRLPPLHVRGQKLRKIIYHIRNLLINICIGSQIVIVIVNKLLVPISIGGFLYLMVVGLAYRIMEIIIPVTIMLFLGIFRMRIIRYLVMVKKFFLRQSEASVNPNEAEHMVGYEQDLRNFVLLLESEAIHDGYLMFINSSINSSIKIGEKHQPRYLTELMENSTSFKGVLKFESDQISPIICTEPRNCWSLSVATLTSILIGNAMESPIDLPENVVIANSMYKISNTLLLVYEESCHSASNTQVFEILSVIFADIFAACLTNLPRVILKKCNNCAIEKREKSIREATHLLGETQSILKALQKLEIPNLSPEHSIYIDEWRTLLKHTNHGNSDSTPSNENIITASSGEVHLDIQELHASATAGEESKQREEER